eukprot:s670_g11.t1
MRANKKRLGTFGSPKPRQRTADAHHIPHLHLGRCFSKPHRFAGALRPGLPPRSAEDRSRSASSSSSKPCAHFADQGA